MREMARGCVVALALAALAGTASAQQVGLSEKKAAAQALIDRFLAESRVMLNCSALDPQTGEIVRKHVAEFIALGMSQLFTAPQLGIDANEFGRRADMEAMMMKDRPFSEVIAFCDENKDWVEKFYKLQVVLLPHELKKLAEQ